MAAIENALLDIKGKALGVPVYELFGGPVRTRLSRYPVGKRATHLPTPKTTGISVTIR
jgi:L-alanine-DL-glutamate epimerase-like enolase superfamily enzyme